MLNRTLFGTLPDGRSVDLIRFGGQGDLEVGVLTYGCIIASLSIPGADGRSGNLVLGFDRLEPYLSDSPYFGAVIGRYANRIAHARFAIDGREHRLTANEPPHHLHGGARGFDKHLWTADAAAGGVGVVLRRRSPDGEEGFPGALDVQVTYTPIRPGGLRIDYEATTDAPTHVNLTNHSYFNLRGSGDVLAHRVVIHASTFLPVDDTLIPTGTVAPVANTPFDFRGPGAIGLRMAAGDPQLTRCGGYDHTFVLDRPGAALVPAARVIDPSSGRTLELHTTEPGVQFYSGQAAGHRGFCLEPQHFPDSPNQPAFPSTLLRPGERYRSTSVYMFNEE